MEKLHSCTPNLEDISFDEARFMDTPTSALNIAGGEPFVNDTTSKLKDIHIIFVETTMDNIARLIVYFGQKYASLENLYLTPGYNMADGFSADKILEDPLTKAVVHMSNLKTYRIGHVSLTPDILKAMDSNGIKLDKIDLYVENEDDLKSQLEILKRSYQAQHLSSIYIVCDDETFDGNAF